MVRRQQEIKLQGESRAILSGVIHALRSLMGLPRKLRGALPTFQPDGLYLSFFPILDICIRVHLKIGFDR